MESPAPASGRRPGGAPRSGWTHKPVGSPSLKYFCSPMSVDHCSSSLPRATTHKLMSTSLYAPFRSLGHVTTDVPFVIHSHSTKDSDVLGVSKAQTNSQVILTSVGLGWALWSADSLRLLYVGEIECESAITCVSDFLCTNHNHASSFSH
jgi:hypothetical protein